MSDTVSETMSDTSAAKEVNLVQERLLQQIDAATSGSQASFCCAGRVSIKQEKDSPLGNNTLDTTDSQLIADPIAIRWDCRDGKTCNKLKLPPDSYDANATDQGALQDLLNDCAPATFGKHDKEVLDESYRKAIKLDVDQFSTNFNPHDVGIIATIAQTLLPGMTVPKTSDGDRAIVENLGVIAELYKLNVSLQSEALMPLLKDIFLGLFGSVRKIQGSCRYAPWSNSIRFSCRMPPMSPSRGSAPGCTQDKVRKP